MNDLPKKKDAINDLRARLRADPSLQFVTAKEFSNLSISNSSLERFEIQAAKLIGLQDPTAGVSYVIECELLKTDRTW